MDPGELRPTAGVGRRRLTPATDRWLLPALGIVWSSTSIGTGTRHVPANPSALLQQTPAQNILGFCEVRLPFDFGFAVAEAVADFLEGVAGHVGAAVAGAGFAC